jgi:hypothetical protein
MPGQGQMSFLMSDVYPGMYGHYDTRATTIPEAEDQQALVDDDEAARENSVHTSPAQHRNIFVSIIVVFIFMFLVSKF